jgi:hypothetical protein
LTGWGVASALRVELDLIVVSALLIVAGLAAAEPPDGGPGAAS